VRCLPASRATNWTQAAACGVGLLFVVTSIGTSVAPNFPFFVVNRLLGVAIGIASNLSPLYIAEVAPASIRGRLVAINQLTIALGVMAAQSGQLAYCTAHTGWHGSGSDTVRFLECSDGLAIDVPCHCLPAAVFFGAMFIVPESPRWLAKKGRARESLRGAR